jgi:hypothetical protein
MFSPPIAKAIQKNATRSGTDGARVHSALLHSTGSRSTGSRPTTLASMTVRELSGILQTKLAVGSAHDPAEAEADEMATRVLKDGGIGRITPHAAPAAVQRKCGCSGSDHKCSACKEEEEKVQRKATGSMPAVAAPASVRSVLSNGGQPLDAVTRAYMEPRFGFDFSRVRIHSDAAAARSANDIHALAYTVNHSIAFSAGSYAPETSSGRRLLAHELAHVIQQRAAPALAGSEVAVGSVNDAVEADAERSAGAIVSGGDTGVSQPRLSSSAVVRRTPAAPPTDTWTTPQEINEPRDAKPPLVFSEDNHSVTVNVTRRFQRCNYVQTTDKRSAAFYNPKGSQLAVDERVCKGSVVIDAFLKEFSDGNAKGVEAGGAVNIAGDKVQGRVEGGVVGQEENNVGGVGARLEGSIKIGGVTYSLGGKYVRKVANKPAGTDPNEVDATAGVKVGDHSVEVKGSDLTNKRQFTVGTSGTFGQPETTQCFICYAPAAKRIYECSKVLHTTPDEPKPETPKREFKKYEPEYRRYFAWNSVNPPEEDYLRTANEDNLKKMKDDLAKPGFPGYRVTSISGYASPEGSERKINRDLAQKRATFLANVVRDTIRGLAGQGLWHGPESVPEPVGRSELLGNNPAPPSPHLRDAVAASTKHSAEEVTALLTGSEILPAEMTSEFLDLFNRTTANDWMQLFGLDADSSLRPEVESAVHAFIDSGGKGKRPWERVFRPLRFAAVTLEGTEMTAASPKEEHAAKKPATQTTSDSKPVDVTNKGLCDKYGEMAEEESGFGPEIEPSILKADSFVIRGKNEVCPTVTGEGTGKTAGCDYEVHEESKQAPPAPAIAPKRL